VADLKKAANELGARAAFEAAKDAAERALDDALSTEEELAARKLKEAELARRKRKKMLAFGIVGLLLVLGVIGMVVHYWQWFFLLGLLGVAGLYGRYRFRKWRAQKQESKEEPKKARVEEPPAKKELVAPTRPARVAERPVAEEPDTSIEDELAALKSRLEK